MSAPTTRSPAALARLQGKKAIRSFARKLSEPETIKDLNITPMMDMMTIILVFLLKSFSSSTSLISLDQLALPPSATLLQPKQAIPVTITKKVIMIEGEAVAPVNGGRVDPQLKPDGANGYLIGPVLDQLTKHANREKKVEQLTGQKFEAELMIVADASTPYRLLTEVLYSCGQAGYANYRLLVLKTRE
jgi:biopolymer transport protein ExbD